MTRRSEQTDLKPEKADKRIHSETESDRLLATDRCTITEVDHIPASGRAYPNQLLVSRELNFLDTTFRPISK